MGSRVNGWGNKNAKLKLNNYSFLLSYPQLKLVPSKHDLDCPITVPVVTKMELPWFRHITDASGCVSSVLTGRREPRPFVSGSTRILASKTNTYTRKVSSPRKIKM